MRKCSDAYLRVWRVNLVGVMFSFGRDESIKRSLNWTLFFRPNAGIEVEGVDDAKVVPDLRCEVGDLVLVVD